MGDENMVTVRDRLQKLMDERGLNMYSLAKRSGLSWNTIKKSSRAPPTPQSQHYPYSVMDWESHWHSFLMKGSGVDILLLNSNT